MSGNNLIINNEGRKRRIITPLIALLIAVVISIAFAAVFVYYPMTVTVSAVEPPILIGYGNNSNQNDLGYNSTLSSSNTILVSVGNNNASLSITIHPTYGVSYYKNISIITNTEIGGKTYNIYIRVVTPINLNQLTGSGSAVSGKSTNGVAKLYIYSKGVSRSLSTSQSQFPTPSPASDSYVEVVDLTTTETKKISLGAGQGYEIDLYIYIPEGASLPSTQTIQLYLIYTPSSETPP